MDQCSLEWVNTTVENNASHMEVLNKGDFIYTSHYCEENIWMLTKKMEDICPEQLRFLYPVFISNASACIPLWRQSVSKQDDGFVLWDYHVILIFCDGVQSLVYDFDSQLPFPSNFSEYCKETFRSDHFLNPLYHRYFRVLTAESYLRNFSSDRRHMQGADGSWIKPPPNYEPIKKGEEEHNLNLYISVNEDKRDTPSNKFGQIFNLNSFLERFSINSKSPKIPVNYMYPPEPLGFNN